MKTLIAAFALTVATAGAAFATDANQQGVPASLMNKAAHSSAMVSGFTGVSGGNDYRADTNQGGIPASLR
ncbi:hypothetical protein [Salaquimonas pukyongi]|uniref:hypothetical protein n=1 Tax=Salaquimonas pukyongi TaxID=2712698 RepID=UPI00096BAA47|nr:hypothetical protein [Salaquimonas pukyongi]